MLMKEPKIIKIMPWLGIDRLEAVEGKKTKISLFEDRLDYHIQYTQKVEITMTSKLQEQEDKESVRYIDEEGFIVKDSISNVTKFVKTEYDVDGKPYVVYVIDIGNSAGIITFEIETLEERDNLYKEIYNWKFAKQNGK